MIDRTVYIDLETYSPVDIKKGVYKYAEQAEIMLFAYALGSGPVQVWDRTKDKGAPADLQDAIRTYQYICAHNSGFDRVILKSCMPGFTGSLQWRDTMVRAYAHGLPGALADLSAIYKLPEDKAKDKDGRSLIHLFCKPQKDGRRVGVQDLPAQWGRFVRYAGLDIEAMRELDRKLPTWNDSYAERALWYLDQKINDRGFAVDVDLARAAIAAVAQDKAAKDKKTQELTDGAVNAATQRDAMLKHLLDIHGVSLPDMTISTLERRLKDPDLPEPVKELIALRLQSSGTSTKKYQTLIDAVNSDNRLRGTLQFCGASRTGRWSGRIFQPQNLPRPSYKSDEIDTGIEALKAGCADLVYSDVKEIAGSAIRGVIVAPQDRKLVIADLSNIEGRVLAWVAGERWKIKAYSDYDRGIGHDLYKLTYAKTFGIRPEDVTKHQRQLGKVLELALGYGGGVGAFVTFANSFGIDLADIAHKVDGSIPSDVLQESKDYFTYCTKEGKTLDLTEDVFAALDSIKRMWRNANAMIESFWKTLEYDVKNALGTGYATQRSKYTVDKQGNWLRIKLPSGRYLCYAGARLEGRTIKYMGVDTYSKKWGFISTYSGKLTENVVQAISRDILAHGMTAAERSGYEVVLSIHDELITEAPDLPEYNAKGLSEIMSRQPDWAYGLPLAAAGFESYRYRKD